MNMNRGSGLPPADLKFDKWLSADVGGTPREAWLDKLTTNGFLVGPWAKGMLAKDEFVTLPAARAFDFYKVEVRDLGFRQEPWTIQVLARIKELGYLLCPADAGPQLRMSNSDQLPGDYYWLAMNAIHEGPSPRLFFIGRSDDGTRWLRGYAANPDFRWVLDAQFVFASVAA